MPREMMLCCCVISSLPESLMLLFSSKFVLWTRIHCPYLDGEKGENANRGARVKRYDVI